MFGNEWNYRKIIINLVVSGVLQNYNKTKTQTLHDITRWNRTFRVFSRFVFEEETTSERRLKLQQESVKSRKIEPLTSENHQNEITSSPVCLRDRKRLNDVTVEREERFRGDERVKSHSAPLIIHEHLSTTEKRRKPSRIRREFFSIWSVDRFKSSCFVR
ncbi:hypothetical protein NL108_017945 [Boleophthalmus pectinirostris]|nr:hypothetical protein NL108_017945 [Boleophthalmus pectinirostris]